MKITFSDKKAIHSTSQALILPIYKDKKLTGQAREIDKKLGGLISEIIKEGYYSSEFGEVHVVYSYARIKAKKIILVGLGNNKNLIKEKFYQAIAKAMVYVGKTRIKKCSIYLGKKDVSELQNIVETAILSLYKFHHYKSKKKDLELGNMEFIIEGKYSKSRLEGIASIAQTITKSVYEVRDLVNHPSNIVNPKELSKIAREIADKKSMISVQVYGEKDLKKMGMGMFLSVAQGSDKEGQMAILDYKPKKYKKTIALAGKGVTFDSGGVSLKPWDKMLDMKMDMSGAAAILGVFKIISKLKPKNIRIIGAFGACENLTGHKAQNPGDIWRSYIGKTVEVLNTDAEGRLVLGDVISYLDKIYKPDCLIDIGTLTGGCVVALGHEYSGVFGNNQKLLDRLLKISQGSYEKLWQLPINEEFHSELKSDVADLKNIGCGREGSAIKCAAFLEEFVSPKTAWAHIDIAGTATQMKPTKAYFQKGGTGAGVKTLIEFIKSME